MEILVNFIIIIVFLLLKGFYSGSEIAMVNSDKLKLRHRAKLGNRGAQLVLDLYKTPDVLLGTTLVGTNIATVTISTLGALMFIDLLGPAGDVVSVIIFTPFLLILGEIVPKSVYQQKADVIVTYIIYLLRLSSWLFFPVIFVFSRAARIATRLVGGSRSKKSGFISREEIRMLLELSDTTASVAQFDRRRVRRIIRFSETTVGEAMIPQAEVVGLEEGSTMQQAIDLVMKRGYNRLPVYRNNLTNVVGVLTLDTWDLMDRALVDKPISAYITSPLYISPKQTIEQALPMMQARNDHMGVVVDEFGSAVGILTMEDVMEEVVGEIDVGYDFEEYNPKRKAAIKLDGNDAYVVDGRTSISEINDKLHTHLSVGEAHTIAGFIVNKLRRIPEAGAFVIVEDYRFTVKEADARTVLKVHIGRP